MSNSSQTYTRRRGKHNTTKPFSSAISFDKIKEFQVKKEENIFKFDDTFSKPVRQISNTINETKIINLPNERINKRKNYNYYESKYSKKSEEDKDNSNTKNNRVSNENHKEKDKRNKSFEHTYKNGEKNQEKPNQDNPSLNTYKPLYHKISHEIRFTKDFSDENRTFAPFKTGTMSSKNFNLISSIFQNNPKKDISSQNKNQIKSQEPEPLESKQSKGQIISNTITINQNEDKTVRRRRPNFPKFERRISDRNISPKKGGNKEEKKDKKFNNKDKTDNNEEKNEKKVKEDRKRKIIRFEEPNKGGKRKKSIDPVNRIRRKSTREFKEFSQTTYIKNCEALCTGGRGDDGLPKINQDTYVLERNINGVLNFNIFGVLDGHGDYGHFASQFVKRYIINRIKSHPLIKGLDNPKEIYKNLTEKGYQIISNIYMDADIQIAKEKFNCEMSGTTCVLVIQLEEHLICANTGDSRAILVYSESPNDNLASSEVYNLSYDCKPDLPKEKKRIEECGGSVTQMMDEGDIPCGPFRVWIRGEQYPGLAMSRSIGDMDAKKVGVIPNPIIIEYTLNYQSNYMIICSDGIWEFISNNEAMKIANKYYLRNDALGLCQDLTNKSTENWLKEDIVVDDITVVVAFF